MPLTRRQKRALAAAAAPRVIDPADRLSRLPDEVLAQILSFLPAQEAVRTCVLARTWRDVWKFARRLRITGGTVQQAKKLVDTLLRLRISWLKFASLDECEIEFRMKDNHDTSCIVDRWTRLSLKCQVQTLRVLNKDAEQTVGAYFSMRLRAFTSSYLTRLELSGIWFQCIDLDLSVCPALEHLEINSCSFAAVRKIMSPSLKRLVITQCTSNEGHLLFTVSAPCLVSLWLEAEESSAPLLESMPELAVAHVRIYPYWYDGCNQTSDGNVDSESEEDTEDYPQQNTEGCLLLEGLAQAKHLVLLAHQSTKIFRRDLRMCPTFSNLKTLVLNGYWCEPADCCALACILEHAPVLENLTVIFSEEVELKYDTVLEGRPDATAKSTTTAQCLKTVKVKGHTVHGVINVLKFLSTLNICFNLE